ncbi:MAG: carbohydrate ABC transporter permease, partial [Chloroflexi bacterium]
MKQKLWQRVLLYTIVIFWSFVCLFPFYWLFTTSFKQPLHVSRG